MRRPSAAQRGSRGDRAVLTGVRGASVVAALLKRAQQWLAARERLLRRWFAHFPARPAPQALEHRQGGAGAIVLPFWWEYESELKCRLALEALLHKLFSIMPTAVT